MERINNEQQYLNFECTKVNSGENFSLFLTNNKYEEQVLAFTFAGGYGFGWKVVHIRENW